MKVNYKIVKQIAVLSESHGFTKELNLISWNGGEPKLDIRSFPKGHEYVGKGITLTNDEAIGLYNALHDEYCEE